MAVWRAGFLKAPARIFPSGAITPIGRSDSGLSGFLGGLGNQEICDDVTEVLFPGLERPLRADVLVVLESAMPPPGGCLLELPCLL